MKKLYMLFVLPFLAAPALCQSGSETGTTAQLAAKATGDVPGDIYRGTVFGAEKKNYASTTLGTRERAKTKFVYDTSLVRAVKVGDADRVRTLLFANVDVNEKNYAGITPMAVAAEKGNMDIIKMLVEEGGAKVNEVSSYGVTPLIAASAAGNVEVVKYLIAHGADVTAKDDLGKTALLHAAAKNNKALITGLIKLNSAATDLADITGNTPLMYAAQAGALDNVQILVAHGADINYKNPTNGISALAAAAAEGQDATVRFLARNGADINIKDSGNRTPLFYALSTNQTKTFNTLINLGADVNAKDSNGQTVLTEAVKQHKPDFVSILQGEKKTNLNAADNAGKTALMYAAADPKSARCTQVLAGSSRVDLNLKDTNGDTALMQAVKNKNQKAVLLLLKTNADLLAMNNDNKTVFELSKEYLAGTPAGNVLDVKELDLERKGQTVLAQKAAEVAALEAQLAQEEAQVAALREQAQQTANVTEKSVQEALNPTVEEVAIPAPSVLEEGETKAEASLTDIAKEIQEAEAAEQAKARQAARAKARKAKQAKARAAARAKAKREAAEKAAAQQAASAQAVYDQGVNAYNTAANAVNDGYNAAGNAYNASAQAAQDVPNTYNPGAYTQQ